MALAERSREAAATASWLRLREYASRGSTLYTVAPGFIETDMAGRPCMVHPVRRRLAGRPAVARGWPATGVAPWRGPEPSRPGAALPAGRRSAAGAGSRDGGARSRGPVLRPSPCRTPAAPPQDPRPSTQRPFGCQPHRAGAEWPGGEGRGDVAPKQIRHGGAIKNTHTLSLEDQRAGSVSLTARRQRGLGEVRPCAMPRSGT